MLAKANSRARVDRGFDGIKCQINEQLLVHAHVHLTVFVNGKPRAIPAGVGIWPPVRSQNYRLGQFGLIGNCQSWLSTHYSDGIVHVEAPIVRTFVLGQFFDLWGQPFNKSGVGPVRGTVTAFVNGQVWTGDLRQIPLWPHLQIQLDVGRPLTVPESITFPDQF